MDSNAQLDLNMSESKGLKRAGPYMRGAASSFGFRKNKNSGNNNDKTAALEQRNYSQEALTKEQHNVTTAIKASPGLVRPGTAPAAAPSAPAGRANRFGFRAPAAVSAPTAAGGRGLSNKVADSSAQVLPGSKAVAVPTPAAAQPRGPVSAASKRPSPSAGVRVGGRPSPPTSLAVTRHAPGNGAPRPSGGSHLPRPQFARVGTAKDAKTAANYGTRGSRLAPIATFDDEIGSSKESSMNEDSGLGSQQAAAGDSDTLHGVDLADGSPRGGQRLRRGAGAARRSLRSLRDDEDDPNVITEIVPIAKVVSRASLRSIASVGGKNPTPSPRPLAARASAKSASSDEFHSDSMLFRDYGDGLDDGSEPKVYIDRRTAEKRPGEGRFMKDYGPEQDEDWGQGEAMADGEWRDEVGAVAIDEELPSEAHPGPQADSGRVNLAGLVAAAAAAADHGLIEDESAPEDSLFSSSPASTSEDSPSPSRHSPVPVADPATAADAARPRRRVRVKRRERDRESRDAAPAPEAPADALAKDASPDNKKEAPQGLLPSPEGSGTPSNSFSLSDGRDFLIDDEIIDQPALTVHGRLHGHGHGHGDDSEMASLTESAASLTLRDHTHTLTSSHHAGPKGTLAAAAALG